MHTLKPGTRLKKGSLSWNSQNYHFPSFSGAGAGAQNSMECVKTPGETLLNKFYFIYLFFYYLCQKISKNSVDCRILGRPITRKKCLAQKNVMEEKLLEIKRSRVIPQLPSIVANYHSPVNSHIT